MMKPRMSGGEEFFGVRADAVLEARPERILRLLQDAAVGGNIAFAVFQTSLPNRGCFALNGFLHS
jgi:hypothetical protein